MSESAYFPTNPKNRLQTSLALDTISRLVYNTQNLEILI
jgi:hypothetical protein